MVKRVGIVGGGQLAWMMADAAKTLGLELVVQTPSDRDPAVTIAHQTVFAPVDDAIATATLAAQTDVVTFENEFVDLDSLAHHDICFRPSLNSLKPLLDKYHQRSFLHDRGLPTPQFWAREDYQPSTFPIVLKTRRHGYDGQGTFILKSQAEWDATLQKLGDRPLVVEEFVPFDRELAVMVARSTTGEVVVYPVVETEQQNQVCRWVIAPADVPATVQQEVERIARSIVESLDVVGIFGIELFLVEGKTPRLLVNEIAPRTHNSGHFSLDACVTSQFEQQLRAVSGLPLGSPGLIADGALMVNLLGFESTTSDYLDPREKLAALPKAFVHWYGKSESRPGRKLGHVTVLLDDVNPIDRRNHALNLIDTIEKIWYAT